jgi:16S rRNA (guanine527-N7)-methyltransferase
MPALEPTSEFLAAAAELGIQFEPGDLEKLGRYLALLLETNLQFNLTSITDPAAAWMRHILDSLTLLPLVAEFPTGSTIIDVGSGGGLPGIPLAIVLPDHRFTLLESTGKKAEFLRSSAAALELENLAVLNTRAEKAGHDSAHRERYDIAAARAVGPMAVIAELTVPFVKPPAATPGDHDDRPSSRVLLIKGQRAEEELAEAKQALYLLHAVHAGTIHTPTGRIVILEKARKTPQKYPRREGEPKHSPLGA